MADYCGELVHSHVSYVSQNLGLRGVNTPERGNYVPLTLNLSLVTMSYSGEAL